jgi:hypothetical protein
MSLRRLIRWAKDGSIPRPSTPSPAERGAPLAWLELGVALQILFARLPGLRLAVTSRYRDAFHFHGLAAPRVEWV